MDSLWWAFDGPSAGPPGPGGGGQTVDAHRPRRGASLYGSYGNTHWDARTFAHMLSDAGLTATDVWCFSGWGEGSRLPFLRRPDGTWDLYAWNEEAFDAAEARTRYDNSYGLRTRWTFLDYYTGFSDRGIRPGLPHPNTGPFRRQNNVNDVDYAGDHAFEIIGGPRDWVSAYVEKFVGRLKGLGADFQVGNEMAESAMHDRILAIVRRVWPEAHVSASRNSDAPSQYMNMVDGHHHNAVNFHGWKNPARLAEVFPEDTDRPKTYRDLLRTPGVDPVKIIACSDGARNGNPDPYHAYDWADLLEAFRFAADHGCNIDHQSACKMGLATYGTYDLKYVEVDFLKQIARF